MGRAAQHVELPWKRTKDGLVAELGAVFRVELKDGGWECSVGRGRGKQVIDSGLAAQREGKQRAEAHAARMPEVKAAVAQRAERRAAKRASPRATEHASAPPAHSPARAGENANEAKGAALRTLEDGCVFGRVGTTCWMANRAEIQFAGLVSPEEEAKIRSAVAEHYAAAARPTPSAASTTGKRRGRPPRSRAPSSTPATETSSPKKRRGRPPKPPVATAESETPKRRGRPPKARAEAQAPHAATSEAPKRRGRPPKARAEVQAASMAPGEPPKRRGRPPKARPEAQATTAATSATGKRRGRPPKARPLDEKGRPKSNAKPVTKAARGRRGRPKAGAKTKESEPVSDTESTGLTWIDLEGKARGSAPHGTFSIEPEGTRHALYFTDAAGQQRHLRSGEHAELRRLAEEMTARGQPAPEREVLSPDKEEALLKMFVSGAVESP